MYSMGVLDGPLVCVDIETNGLSHVRGRVIEVAAIRIEQGKVVSSLNQLVDPEAELPVFITELTGIAQRDLRTAPTFMQIAHDLHALLEGAVFVAHNVRFDYAFLKQEFKRAGLNFLPRQLCTMRLSRQLYPEQRGHKLEDLIRRHGLHVARRHRAYDDAVVLWDFLRHLQSTLDTDMLETVLRRQLKQPSLPKGLSPELLASLPDTSGVYIFEDDKGYPLYVGKSIHIRQRVQSHFGRDHEASGEFKIAQAVRNIRVQQTAGELEALLLESRLVKELQPLYNKRLRKTSKLLLARQVCSPQGYLGVKLEEADVIQTHEIGTILGVYTTRGKARESIDKLVKDFSLCPVLCGLEKSTGACFMHQLRKCYGACAGKEAPATYNQRLLEAFARRRIQEWPFPTAVLITEGDSGEQMSGIVVDQWCVVAQFTQQAYCEPQYTRTPPIFDLDTYKILQAYLKPKKLGLQIKPISLADLQMLS